VPQRWPRAVTRRPPVIHPLWAERQRRWSNTDDPCKLAEAGPALAAGPGGASELAARAGTSPPCRQMAVRAGGGRVRVVRPGRRHRLDDRGAGIRAGQPPRQRLRPGWAAPVSRWPGLLCGGC